MKLSLLQKRILLFTITAVAVAAVLVVNLTEICQLEAVTLDGEPVDSWSSKYGLSPEHMLLRQPVDSLAAALLKKDGIVKVDIDYRLPDAIDVRTNNFAPVCLVVDKASGRMKGLNALARVVTLGRSEVDWERPVLTNVEAKRLYDYCDDPRVRTVVNQLTQLRAKNVDLFRLIDEIDFDMADYLVISISGLPYRLKVKADKLLDQVSGFVRFLEQFDPDLENTRALDMRFDEMIVRVEKRK